MLVVQILYCRNEQFPHGIIILFLPVSKRERCLSFIGANNRRDMVPCKSVVSVILLEEAELRRDINPFLGISHQAVRTLDIVLQVIVVSEMFHTMSWSVET